MNQRAAYLIQILEKIGSPLMAAIAEAAPGEAENPAQEAQTMAALLAKTVQASIDLGHVMDINPAEAMDDSLRVALAALAGPIVAGQFRKRGQIPEEAALKRVTNALQAVLAFSENFAPGPESAQRLKELEARGQVADPNQTHVQYVQAFVPVVEAIAAFPFGQPEQKLLMEVSDRLVKKAVELRETLLPGVSDEKDQKRAELGLLRALAGLYSASHRAETAKAMTMDEAARSAGLSMEPVWRRFDVRAAMLEALAGTMIPGAQSGKGGGHAPAAPAQQPPAPAQAAPIAPPAPPPAQPPVQEQAQEQVQPAAQPVQPPPPAQPVQPPQQPQAVQPAAQNPMALFAKPQAGAATAPAQPPVQPPAPVSPPPESATVPAPPPPAGEGGDPADSPPKNPMTFFKKTE